MPLLRLCLIAAIVVTACSKPDLGPHGAPPPAPASASAPFDCASGGGVVRDPVSTSFFPKTVGSYCIDPQAEVRTYGDQAKLALDAVCTTAFDGDCTVYDELGLRRLVSLRYADGGGSGGTVDVYLSRFADATGSYAMFTQRVVGDADPAEPTTPKPLQAGAAGAMGIGRAYVWRDQYLIELQYNNEAETPEAIERSSAGVLGAIAQQIGGRLPGSTDLPPSVRALPGDHRIPNGTLLVAKDALGVRGLGPLAVGYYADGAARYREVALAAESEAKTVEAWDLVRAGPDAAPVPDLGGEAVRTTFASRVRPEAPPQEYLFARRGKLLVGIGDEELGAAGADGKPGSRLGLDQKVARLRAWISSLPAAASKTR
jgi:hypothetical protein